MDIRKYIVGISIILMMISPIFAQVGSGDREIEILKSFPSLTNEERIGYFKEYYEIMSNPNASLAERGLAETVLFSSFFRIPSIKEFTPLRWTALSSNLNK